MTKGPLVALALAVACIDINPSEVDVPVRPPVVEKQPIESDLLEINVTSDTLDLINRTADPVFYFIAEPTGVTPAVLSMPCSDPATCPAVTRRDTRRIALASIPLGPTALSIVVLHWRLVPAATASGFKPDSVRTTIVPLL